jgi:transposase-like protein
VLSLLFNEAMKVERSRVIGSIAYLVFDSRYKNIRQDSTVINCAVLMASGIWENIPEL